MVVEKISNSRVPLNFYFLKVQGQSGITFLNVPTLSAWSTLKTRLFENRVQIFWSTRPTLPFPCNGLDPVKFLFGTVIGISMAPKGNLWFDQRSCIIRQGLLKIFILHQIYYQHQLLQVSKYYEILSLLKRLSRPEETKNENPNTQNLNKCSKRENSK